MIFEPVEVLVSLSAHLAPIGLFLFHSDSAWVRLRSVGINDGESAVTILLQLLGGVTVLERCEQGIRRSERVKKLTFS